MTLTSSFMEVRLRRSLRRYKPREPATAASIAIDEDIIVQDVSCEKLSDQLKKDD